MIIPMIDYLSFGVDVEDYQEAINNLVDKLQACKELAKQNAVNKLSDKSTIELGGCLFEVKANGANGYAFILHNDEYEIKLAQYRSTHADFFPIKITIRSQCLWALSPESSYIKIYNWIESTFGKIVSSKVSRVDLCCHNDLLISSDLSIESFKGNFKTNNLRTHNRIVSGIEFGSRESKIYCRIYDKTLEVTTKRNKLWFFSIWRNNGYKVGEVWNVEFELKREFFSTYGIESIEDMFSSIKSIWDYCTKDWLVKIERDRTRIENCTVSPEWEQISNCFDMYISKPLIKREEQRQADAEALLPATIGYITTVSALLGENNIDSSLFIIKSNGKQYLENKDHTYKTIINEKIDLLGSGK